MAGQPRDFARVVFTCHHPEQPVSPIAGRVTLERKAIAQLIGKVFIQKAAVNLLSTVRLFPCACGRTFY
jgi:3-hydroxymyristoyl/3-hydroxydecanoyl-(acyl carrier protein) dehydratase